MKKFLSALFLTIITVISAQGQNVIRLYPGKAPGSEGWNWKEQDLGGGFMRDVVDPTLTVFQPANPNGIAVIVAPGGAYHYLVTKGEGSDVAKRLNEKGITAFVLKYRLVHEDPAHPYLDKMLKEGDWKLLEKVTTPVLPLATQDAVTAMKYVREHAAEYKIDPNKIGFEGSSAGGTIAISLAANATEESRPDFIASIYGYTGGLLANAKVPATQTPIFVCAAIDDQLVPVSHSIQLATKWLESKQPVEMHIYQKGNHGFVGNPPQHLPVDAWFDRFSDWIFMIYPPAKN